MLDLSPPINDGLFIPDVGEWSGDKHHFLRRYLDAFTTAMKDKPWSGLHYIDLFAGAGIERREDSKQLDWGSPLIAAQTSSPFTQLHLCEKEKKRFQALKNRVGRFRADSNDQLLHMDANKAVDEIVRAIPRDALSMAFLDPYGLHLDYETLRTLSNIRADLLIFFPDRLDILRNWKTYYWDNPESNLDAVLGPDCDWRRRIEDEVSAEMRVQVFARLYEEQIKKLGYTFFEREGIPSNGPRLYWLIFCSRHKVALKIWKGVSEKKPDGQRTFDLG